MQSGGSEVARQPTALERRRLDCNNHEPPAVRDYRQFAEKVFKVFLITEARDEANRSKKLAVDSFQRMGHSHGQTLAVGRSVNALGFFGVG